jgi:hypothetical protein
MNTIKRYDPYLSDCGEADLEERSNGDWVSYREYANLYKKYIRARSALSKEKIKKEIKNAN